MRLIDRLLLATHSPRARAHVAYRLLLGIVVLERAAAQPARVRADASRREMQAGRRARRDA